MRTRAASFVHTGALVALSVLLPLAAAAERPAAGSPDAVVEELHAQLLEIMMEAEALGFEGRFARLEPVMSSTFDLAYMAEKSVGRHWKTASQEERERLLSTFQRYIVATYAGRFTGYEGQHFETLKREDSSHGTVIVHTRVVLEDGDEDVQLNYRLRQSDGSWKIVDVYLNGTVSELALRRSEYSALIKRDGFEALLVAIDEKATEMGSTPSS